MNNLTLNTRKKLIRWLFENSQNLYTKLFKKNKIAWNINKDQLLKYPKISFGRKLGVFLKNNNFDLLPKLERHDCYHVITGYKTKAEDEIALQYLCFGNGKRSPYLFFVIILGTLLLPDYFSYYKKSYTIGKNANTFYGFEYKKLLHIPLENLQTAIFKKEELNQINNLLHETI